jgi:hypothetical protein
MELLWSGKTEKILPLSLGVTQPCLAVLMQDAVSLWGWWLAGAYDESQTSSSHECRCDDETCMRGLIGIPGYDHVCTIRCVLFLLFAALSDAEGA